MRVGRVIDTFLVSTNMFPRPFRVWRNAAVSGSDTGVLRYLISTRDEKKDLARFRLPTVVQECVFRFLVAVD